MSRVFHPLLFLIARSTHQLLARHLEFDDAQIEMVRERVPKKNIHLRADQTTRKLRIRDRLKLPKSTRVSELAFNAISVRDGAGAFHGAAFLL